MGMRTDTATLQRAVNAAAAHPTKPAAAKALGIPYPTLYSQLEHAKRLGIKADRDIEVDPALLAKRAQLALEDRIKELQSQITAMHRQELTEEKVRDKIFGLAKANLTPPKWALEAPKKRRHTAVPVALWSDWHWGEVVEPAQVNGINQYNLVIARQRLRVLVNRIISLTHNHVVDPNYPGIVVNLGGDMVSGDIHEELAETNDLPSGPIVVDLVKHLTWALETLADKFGRVFVPCVAGNHGRMTRRPRFKNRAYTNFDWVVYNLLEMQFKNDPRVVFLIPDGADAAYNVFGHRYLLTHGDNLGVKGGDGIIGALGPILRGETKVRNSSGLMGKSFDTLLMGHWHQYLPLFPRLCVNGCLKGYDEFAMLALRAGPERPQQALWLNDSVHGPIRQDPVFVTEMKRGTGEWAEAA